MHSKPLLFTLGYPFVYSCCCNDTIKALSQTVSDRDFKEAFESLYKRGVLQKRGELTSWSQQRYCLNSELAYADPEEVEAKHERYARSEEIS